MLKVDILVNKLKIILGFDDRNSIREKAIHLYLQKKELAKKEI